MVKSSTGLEGTVYAPIGHNRDVIGRNSCTLEVDFNVLIKYHKFLRALHQAIDRGVGKPPSPKFPQFLHFMNSFVDSIISPL